MTDADQSPALARLRRADRAYHDPAQFHLHEFEVTGHER